MGLLLELTVLDHISSSVPEATCKHQTHPRDEVGHQLASNFFALGLQLHTGCYALLLEVAGAVCNLK